MPLISENLGKNIIIFFSDIECKIYYNNISVKLVKTIIITFNSLPKDEIVIPLPNPLTTPPVTITYFMFIKHKIVQVKFNDTF